MSNVIARDAPLLITTKFSPPRLTRTPVYREEASEQLSCVLTRAVALVTAPAGFGKTTLLTSWRTQLQAKNMIVAWLTLDQDDNDETRFIDYLIGTLAAALGHLADEIPEFQNAGKVVSVRVYLTSIINALDKLGREVALILDDYEKITDPKVHDLLAFLLRHIPANLHIVAASRTEPPIPLAALRARDQLVEIKTELMRFGVGDTQTFFANAISANLSFDEIRALHDATEGWGVGLQLVTLLMPRYPDVSGLISSFTRHSRVLAEYLSENVLTQIPVSTVDFMMRTSILNRLNGSLCARLTGVVNASETLEWLVKQNLFLQPLDEDGQWYSYHGLFADFLRTELRRRLPFECERLHLSAAQWFSEQEYWTEAVRHALAADRVDLAAEWMELCALGELRSGRVRNFLGWLQKLPADLLKQRFSLRIAQIWALILTVQTKAARALAREVEDQLSDAQLPNEDEFRRILRAQRVSILSMQDQITEALELGKTVWQERFPDGLNPRQGFDWTDEAFLNAMLHLHRKAGELEAARQVVLFYRPGHEVAQNLLMMSYRSGLFAALDILEKQMHGAAQRLESALEICERYAGRRSASATFMAASLAGIYYEWNRLDAVEELLANRCDVIDDVCFIEPTRTAYLSLVRIRISKGQLDAAWSILNHTETLAENRDWLGLAAACIVERIRLQLLENHVAAAEQSCIRLDVISVQSLQSDLNRVDVEMMAAGARGRLLLHMERFSEAELLLSTVVSLKRKNCRAVTPYEIAQIEVLLAVALYRSGKAEEAQACLGRVLELTIPAGIIRLLVDEGTAIVPILEARATEEGEASPDAEYYSRIFGAIGIDAPFKAWRLIECSEPALSLDPNTLSQRESVILELLMENSSNKQIAKSLFITPETVKWHLKNIYQKLGVCDRRQAAGIGRHLLG
ncbi:LuxR C-terminal-related transcriptional regulator [Pseudomonas fluorescens]|uniref:HTH-type transcriptional regulator MalT n=1 Tax=Pseudomonas fluorescens TaxID=294 RepID=A0A5E7V7N2_PSEFL|nr:LuxR C-terminal-related transcriptional regulator [Pseudomonas fluorescens]VVQ15654.1 HTH-type transcriptional regulator MalT [Pseudomonas fluorescens]